MPNDLPPHAEPPEADPSAQQATSEPPAANRRGFSAEELSAAARVIAYQVKLATERDTPKPP
jgi:hypothetical protein